MDCLRCTIPGPPSDQPRHWLLFSQGIYRLDRNYNWGHVAPVERNTWINIQNTTYPLNELTEEVAMFEGN